MSRTLRGKIIKEFGIGEVRLGISYKDAEPLGFIKKMKKTKKGILLTIELNIDNPVVRELIK